MGERDPKYIGQRKKIILPSAIVLANGTAISTRNEIQANMQDYYFSTNPEKKDEAEAESLVNRINSEVPLSPNYIIPPLIKSHNNR